MNIKLNWYWYIDGVATHIRCCDAYTPYAVRNEPEPVLRWPSIRARLSTYLYADSGHLKIVKFLFPKIQKNFREQWSVPKCELTIGGLYWRHHIVTHWPILGKLLYISTCFLYFCLYPDIPWFPVVGWHVSGMYCVPYTLFRSLGWLRPCSGKG